MKAYEQPSAAFLEQVVAYQLPPEQAANLADKVLVPVIGAACVGKTTIIANVVEMNSDYHPVQTLTTREPSARDISGTMRYLPHNQEGFDELAELMAAGQIAQIEPHPSTGFFYATEVDDYPKPYNIIPILASAMPNIRRMPFQRIDTVAISAQAEYWHDWFRDRYAGQDKFAEAQKRLDEAEFSLRWCLEDEMTYWVKNEPGKAVQAAGDLIYAIENGDTLRPGGRGAAQSMLGSIDTFRTEFTDRAKAS